mgnify:CR=1 FL=1
MSMMPNAAMTENQQSPSEAAKRLKELRVRAGLSMKEVADALGWSLTKYQHYEDRYKKAALPIEMQKAIVELFTSKGVALPEVFDLFTVKVSPTPRQMRNMLATSLSQDLRSHRRREKQQIDESTIFKDNAKQWNEGVATNVPIFAKFHRGSSGRLTDVSVQDWVTPTQFGGETGIYGVYVNDESMAPRYIPGEVVYAHPGRPITHGCFVVAWQSEDDSDEVAIPFIAQYIWIRDGSYHFLTLKPERKLEIPEREILRLDRIVLAGER